PVVMSAVPLPCVRCAGCADTQRLSCCRYVLLNSQFFFCVTELVITYAVVSVADVACASPITQFAGQLRSRSADDSAGGGLGTSGGAAAHRPGASPAHRRTTAAAGAAASAAIAITSMTAVSAGGGGGGPAPDANSGPIGLSSGDGTADPASSTPLLLN